MGIVVPAYDSYIICSTPCTGSTLLCDMLAATHVAGTPDSFFMGNIDPAWAGRWGLPAGGDRRDAVFAAATLKAAIAAGSGQTGVFGLRLMRDDLDDLSALIDAAFPGLPSDNARLAAAFGRVLYIHLNREDHLGQAVSMVKAEQTGLWHRAPDGTELERLAPPREPEYDFRRIADKLAQLEQSDAAWRTWFRDQGIDPLRIRYEVLSADPADAVSRICEALEVPAPAREGLIPGVARLADAVNEDWMSRYRRDVAPS